MRLAEKRAADAVEAAALVCEDMMPKNDPSDWTEYAKDKHAILTEAARRIRALGVASSPEASAESATARSAKTVPGA